MRPKAAGGIGLLAALLAATFVIRAPITSVPPVLPLVRAHLQLAPVAAGLVTTLPVVCFGVFAFITPWLVARVGGERTLALALIAIGVGVAIRLTPSTVPFFAGILSIGLGIAVANVVIPAIARARFPGSLARVMGSYTVMIQLSGSLGAFLTRPLLNVTGWSWPAVLGLWLVPVVAALGWWALASGRLAPTVASPPAADRLRAVARRPIAWGVALVLGLQSTVFYSMANWMPTELHLKGWSLDSGGFALGAFNLLGLPGSLLGARILTMRRRVPVIVAVTLLYVLGLSLLLAGQTWSVVGVVLAGLCQGPTLAVGLSAIAHQPDPHDVPAVSAIAQGGGYLLAALGPVIVGGLYGATSGFAAATLFLVGCLVVWAAATIVTTRALERSPHQSSPG